MNLMSGFKYTLESNVGRDQTEILEECSLFCQFVLGTQGVESWNQ